MAEIGVVFLLGEQYAAAAEKNGLKIMLALFNWETKNFIFFSFTPKTFFFIYVENLKKLTFNSFDTLGLSFYVFMSFHYNLKCLMGFDPSTKS